ncbi:MAG: glycine dehydrogenase, partial [Gammaproteobacteria bacterium]|nr:glycine dehydrogenase [Gammaproteobacteria bacterium]
IPLASDGPYFGFMCSKMQFARQLPGRIVGRTVDLDGKEGFTLTLQAREQHIRRSKATSNICTNQGLMVTAATIYLSIMGFEGIRQAALASHQNTQKLIEKLSKIDGVSVVFNSANFHEVALKLNVAADDVIAKLADHNIVGGVSLANDYPELENALLVCATETKTEEDLDLFCEKLAHCLS